MPKPVKPSLSLKMSLRFSSSIFASSLLDLTVDDDEHEENIAYSSDTVVEENKEQHFTLTRAITWVMVQEQHFTLTRAITWVMVQKQHFTLTRAITWVMVQEQRHTNKGNNLGHGTTSLVCTEGRNSFDIFDVYYFMTYQIIIFRVKY